MTSKTNPPQDGAAGLRGPPPGGISLPASVREALAADEARQRSGARSPARDEDREAALERRLAALEGAIERMGVLAEALSAEPNPFVLLQSPEEGGASARARSLDAPRNPDPAEAPRARFLLEDVPASPRTARILLAWASELLDTVGPARAVETLASLEEIGWIAPSVRRSLARLVVGIGATPEGERASAARGEAVAPARALDYIEALTGTRDLDEPRRGQALTRSLKPAGEERPRSIHANAPDG